jgi:hypothetical protein
MQSFGGDMPLEDGHLEDWEMRGLHEANLEEICCEDEGGGVEVGTLSFDEL